MPTPATCLGICLPVAATSRCHRPARCSAWSLIWDRGSRRCRLPGLWVVFYTSGLIEAYGKLGGLDDEEVVELVRQREFALLHERPTPA